MQVINQKTRHNICLTAFESGKVLFELKLIKTKSILGRGEKSDLFINDDRVSFYHAFIEVVPGGIKVLDLSSINGTYLNGEKVESCFIASGDRISFGGIEFLVSDLTELNNEYLAPLEDEDQGKVIKIESEDISEKLPELEPKGGFAVIDGEYCDISFNEKDFTHQKNIDAYDKSVAPSDFVDVYEEKPNAPIAQKTDSQAMRVTILTMGNIVSIEYIPLKGRKTIFMSSDKSNPNTLLIPTLFENDRLPFIQIKNDEIHIYKPSNHQFYDLKQSKSIKAYDNEKIVYHKGDEYSFTLGSVEIRVETVKSPPKLKNTSFFESDRALQKESAKVFSIILAFVLLFLFIDVERPVEEEKKIAVVYRQIIKNQVAKEAKFSKDVAKSEKQVGQKPTEQEKTLTKPMNSAKKFEPVKTTKKKVQRINKKIANSKSKKLPKRSRKVAKKPIKTYELKLDRSLSSFLNKKQNVKIAEVDKSSTLKDIGQAQMKVSSSKVSAKSNINLGTFGKDYKGKLSHSTGTKGLSRKKGFDTTYMEPKTVVLGSMDPDLLRKILREYLPQFRHCYQKELELHSDEISGVIDLKFRIGNTGRAQKVNILSKDARFSRKGTGCMASVLKLINFPRPKGGGVVDVKQPLNFFSEKGKI